MSIPIITLLWVLGIASMGGLVSYLNKPEPKTIGGVLVVLITSGFTGFMAYCICVENKMTVGWTTVIVGVIGMMGKRAGDDFIAMVRGKLGLPAQTSDQNPSEAE